MVRTSLQYVYHVTEAIQAIEGTHAVVGSIVIVDALMFYALLHFMYDLKATQINVQCSLIWELMLYEFELDPNAAEATKNICCAKDGGTVDNSRVTRWLKIVCLGCKNLNNQAKSGRPRSMDSETMLQAIETNLASSTWRVSGELSISQSSLVYYLHDLSKSIHSCQIVPHSIKMMENV